MTKPERRIRDFSLGMKKLGKDSRGYIHKLAHVLLLVEKPPVCPVEGKYFQKGKTACMGVMDMAKEEGGR